MEVVPASAPNAPSQAESKVLEIARHGFLDPIYVSRAEGMLLVSEDLHFRGYAQALHGVEGAWLQACLMVRATLNRGLREYLIGWARGHFLPVSL